MSKAGQTVGNATDSLKSDNAQRLSAALDEAQKKYSKAVSVTLKAAENAVSAKAELAAWVEALKGGPQQGAESDRARTEALGKKTSTCEEAFLTAEQQELAACDAQLIAARTKRDYIKTVYDNAQSVLSEVENKYKLVSSAVAEADPKMQKQKMTQPAKDVTSAKTECSLAEAALGDIEAKLKEIEILKQEKGKKRRNPAPNKRSTKEGSLASNGLEEEIVAILAKADKVKTNKTDTTVEETAVAKKPAAPKKTEAAAPKTEKKAAPKAAKADSAGRYRLKAIYKATVVPALIKQFGYKNVNEVPKLDKILINMGLGDVKEDGKKFNAAVEELKIIAGQKPIVTKAKKSVANFKVRQGMNIGAKVTIRGNHMYEFFDKLISIALPRVRDFKGVNPNSFDGRGNFAMGVKEQLIFPEIKYDQIDKIRGFDVVVVTTAATDEESKALLTLLGMPFRTK